MNVFKQIVFAAKAVIDELKWPAIEASVMRRLDDKIADVAEAESRAEAQKIDTIRRLGSTTDRAAQEELIEELLAIDMELGLVREKAANAAALKAKLREKAPEVEAQ